MRIPPPGSRPSLPPLPAGFTILELLTATAVLALILLLLVQVINATLQSTRIVGQQLDTTAIARRAIDVLSADIRKAARDGGADILVNPGSTNLLAVLTRGRTPNPATDSRLLAVRYAWDGTNSLSRSYGAVDWAVTDLANAATNVSGGTSQLADGILGIHIAGIQADGSRTNFSGSGWTGINTNVTTLEITVAALDSQNYLLLKNTGKLSAATNAFPAPTSTDSAYPGWNTNLNTLTNIPGPARAAIRIMTKTVQLP